MSEAEELEFDEKVLWFKHQCQKESEAVSSTPLTLVIARDNCLHDTIN